MAERTCSQLSKDIYAGEERLNHMVFVEAPTREVMDAANEEHKKIVSLKRELATKRLYLRRVLALVNGEAGLVSKK